MIVILVVYAIYKINEVIIVIFLISKVNLSYIKCKTN